MSDVERLLRYALVPVDPPATLADELERRLTELADAAVDELTDWDPRALRDPRRWVRLAAAGAVAAGAGGALIVVRSRHRRPPAPRLASLTPPAAARAMRRTLRLVGPGAKRRTLPIGGGGAR